MSSRGAYSRGRLSYGTARRPKVDGVVTLTCVDRGSEVGGPLNGGWFGFRQFGGAQRCLYDNFRVTRLGE